MSDYMTAEELKKSTKPKKMRKKKDKKTGLRKKVTEEEDEGEDDFGSRRDKISSLDDVTVEKEARQTAFLAAKSKANSKITESIMKIDNGEKGEYVEEVDSELSASLARVRVRV